MLTIDQRLEALREIMDKHNIDAVIVPTSDPHQSEYVADRWKTREWISGFTGSAGTAVICKDYAGLWTDSRYFIQAEEELAQSQFVLNKVLNYNPDFVQFLLQKLLSNARVACDGNVFSFSEMADMDKAFSKKDISVITDLDLIDPIWEDRAPVPQNEVMIHEVDYTGKSTIEKLDAIRENLKNTTCECYLLTALDDIAWTFNLRGNDIECNPVFISYAVIYEQEAILYIEASKLTKPVSNNLHEQGVEVKDYDQIFHDLKAMTKNQKLYLSAAGVNDRLYKNIEAEILDGPSIVADLKAIKSEVEIDHIRRAMEKDGVALTKLYRWLEKKLNEVTVSEFEVAKKLAEFRSEQSGYQGESFDAIVGYGSNGAIVHYKPDEKTSAQIHKESILLLDSGGQYLDGTTDITRTTALGPVTDEQKRNFTLVLKGHIAVDSLEFPEGTNGYQVDAFARQHLWKHGLNYFHGTGHGVGYFLNVHEGPQGISFVMSERSKRALMPGMLTSNEPGFYLEGEYGIRIENLIVCRKVRETEFGTFLSHETLSLFPIDQNLIDTKLLTKEEITWIDDYHQKVFERLTPFLNNEEKEWLALKCKSIK